MKKKIIIIMSILLIIIGVFSPPLILVGNVIGDGSKINYSGFIMIILGLIGFIFISKGSLDNQLEFDFEGVSKEKNKRKPREIVSPKYYKKFVGVVEAQGIPMSRFKWRKTKQELLEKYFSNQFLEEELGDYSDRKIGEVFAKVLKQARKYSKQAK